MASNLRMLEKDEEADTEVAWADQQHINEFSRLNTKVSDWEDQLADKKKEKEFIDDLLGELELADEDEPVRYKIGEAFVELPLEQVQERLAKEQSVLTDQIDKIDEQMSTAQTRMTELKAILYGKFGKAINLDK
ncbi:Prefoldin subunit-domain-containing protein [Syncephalis fuscata]|nr:Prefoldin subunit-domain-containing protein [Syncephalis fuscata]